MRLLALFPSRMNPDGIAQFIESSLGEGWTVEGAGSPHDDIDRVRRADAMLVALVDIDAEAIAQANELRFIQTPSHGFDHVDVEAAARRSIPVCNVGTSGAEAGTVAEHAFCLMLACARKLIDAHQALTMGEWPQVTGQTVELQGKTLGIVGLGHIGREVAKRGRAFEMNLLYHDVVPAPEDEESELRLERVELDELLRRSDFISVHVPLMPSTRGLIGAEQIRLMQQHTVLVNTSRGPVVDTVAVAEAANEGRISAGIDVFDPEPPPADDPLRTARNVVLTPHIAGTTRESVQRIMAAALDNLRRFASGETPKDVVNGVDV